MAFETHLVGRTLSHYRITKKIGEGGMGEVYLAQDTRLDRTVALKILPDELASDESRMRRFVREAKAASALDHPNVAHVYEIDEADGIHFIAMQYIEGKTLDQLQDGGPLDANRVVEIAIQIADALSESHAKGIVHRDLKPANVMISARGQVKVLDFGLARLTGALSDSDAAELPTRTQTEAGIVMGTLPYMSPEQSLGHTVDQRTDIFSLGVVLYELLTARRPFGGNNPMEIAHHITQSQPDPISRFNYNVPAELERIVRKCLEKQPERRYQSATDLMIDLKNLQRDGEASRASHPYVASPPRARRKISIALLTLAVVAALTVAALLYFRAAQSDKSLQSLAVLPFINVNGNPEIEYLTDGITDSIINNLSQLREVKVMARGTVFAYKNKEVDPRQVGRELNVDAIVSGRLVQQGDTLAVAANLVEVKEGAQIWGEEYTRKASDILAVQSDISRRISEKVRLRLSGEEQERVAKLPTRNNDAYQLYLYGNYYLEKRTEDGTRKAIEYFRQAIDKDPQYALAYAGLGGAYTFLGLHGATGGGFPPTETMPQAKAAIAKALELDRTLTEAHMQMGHIAWLYDWDWTLAEKECQRAIELNPNHALARGLYGMYLASMERFDEAIAERQKALELDPLSIAANMPFGVVLFMAQRYDEAIVRLRKTAEIEPNYPTTYYYMGLALIEKGLTGEAIVQMKQAVNLSRRLPLSLAGLAQAYAADGQRNEAEKLLAELLELSKQRYVSAFNIAVIYTMLGQKDQALEWLNRAYDERAHPLTYLKVDPRLQPLHSDPRFQTLLQRMKLT